MGIVLSTKKITPREIPLKCDGISEVELRLTATNDLISNPVDIMLVLDESGSMDGEPLTSIKEASKQFIDIIDESTNNGTITGTLGGGSTIGIVKFDTDASFILPPGLTTNTLDLKNAIDTLSAGGFTCHGCAFKVARESFNPLSTNKKIIIMFTDGQTTVPLPNPDTESSIAKAQGIEIYCIGLNAQNFEDNLITRNLFYWRV